MIIPSIDIQSGEVVQLVGGKERALSAGAPEPILKRFRIAGEVAVIDLDAARGRGSNTDLIRPLLSIAPVRVGGGIRSKDVALDWLDAGAAKIILGTAATPELLKELPRERIIAAVDGRNGQVVDQGWERETNSSVLDKIKELKPFVSGFLVTFVESEGRLQGIDLEKVREVIQAAAPVRVTVAGGVTTLDELKAINLMGADAQVGMALYTKKIDLGDAISAMLPAGELWPTVVCNERAEALGLVYSNAESVRAAVEECRGIYFSRKRGLWKKGESSGATQELLKIDLDCDSDALRFTVRQSGTGFCHNGTPTCWGETSPISELEKTLRQRKLLATEGSYSKRLFEDPALLNAKLLEEAKELTLATSQSEVRDEAADVLYFTLAKLAANNISYSEVEAVLKARSRKVRRRPGDAKPSLLGESRSVISYSTDTTGIATRVKQITTSAIKQMPLLARAVPNAVSLGQGIPSIPTPDFIIEAVVSELRENPAIGKYSLQPGLVQLREAISIDLANRKNMVAPDPEKEIFVSCGGMEALAAALSSIIDVGDEVLLCSPGYSSHIEQVLFAQGIPRFVSLDEANGWSLDPDKIKASITSKTKAIVLSSPANPTGSIFPFETLRDLAEVAAKAGIWIVTDETYDFLTFDGNKNFSLTEFPEIKERLILCGSFSKRFCMTGWRVGFLCGPARVVDQILKVHDAFVICAPTVSQYAALAALNASKNADSPGTKFVNDLRQTLQRRRDLICNLLNELPDLFSSQKPQGAYYAFPKFELNGVSSIELAKKLLYQAEVITIPGSAFGPDGEGHIRLSFAGEEANIEEAFRRISSWWKRGQK